MQPSEEIKRFNYLYSEIDALYHKAAVKLGISDSEQKIIYTLCIVGNRCSQSEICRLSGVSRQTINSAIRKLEKCGIIYLEPGQGKNTLVCLTEKGKSFSKEKAYPIITLENEIFASWTENERYEYLRLTEKYLNDMKKRMESFPKKLNEEIL